MTFRLFISSAQDEFAEERRRLKEWLTTDLFVSRFVESVFLFEDVPSRGKPPQEVFLDEVKSSDIYIGLIGSQYYGKASMERGISATEQEYDAAGAVDCERWVYLKAVDKRDAKAATFVTRVNRDVTRTMFETFADLKSAVYASFVAFLDRRELIKVGDFDLGLSERQKKAVRWLKVNRHIAASDYMSLTHVARNTATRDLNKLVAFGVLVAEGSGKYSFYSLNRLCTINAPYALSSDKVTKDAGSLTVLHGNVNEKARQKAREGINEGLNDGINEGIKYDVFRLILEKPGCRVPFLAKALSVSRATVERAVAAFIIMGKIEHRGSKKTGGYYAVSGKESGDGIV